MAGQASRARPPDGSRRSRPSAPRWASVHRSAARKTRFVIVGSRGHRTRRALRSGPRPSRGDVQPVQGHPGGVRHTHIGPGALDQGCKQWTRRIPEPCPQQPGSQHAGLGIGLALERAQHRSQILLGPLANHSEIAQGDPPDVCIGVRESIRRTNRCGHWGEPPDGAGSAEAGWVSGAGVGSAGAGSVGAGSTGAASLARMMK